MLSAIGKKDVATFWRLTAERTRLQQLESAAWDDAQIDAVVCPPHVTAACTHGASGDFSIAFCYAARYNLLNLPAGVVPVTRVRPDETTGRAPTDRIEKRAAAIEAEGAGLPVGVQVVGRPYREDLVLAVMDVVESHARRAKLFPWTPITPGSR
jgi:fatty acid amide hydrolase